MTKSKVDREEKRRIDLEKIEAGARLILEGIGEDLERPGIKDTPHRVARMFEEICAGLYDDPRRFIHFIPDECHDEIVIVKDIPLISLCEHHLLPFKGQVHIAYIPKDGRIVGLSKLARVADVLARKPQLQERLTSEIADLLDKELNPSGVIVVIEAEHLCIEMRGIKKPGTKTVTSAIRGIFIDDTAARAEALALLKG